MNIVRLLNVKMPEGTRELDECRRRIRELGQHVIADCIEIGKHLITARGILRAQYKDGDHEGQWRGWLKYDIEMSHMQAARFIRVAERHGGGNDVVTPLLKAPFSVLAELSAPEADQEVVNAMEQQIAAGETVTVAAVRAALKGKKKGAAKAKELQGVWDKAKEETRKAFLARNEADIKALFRSLRKA